MTIPCSDVALPTVGAEQALALRLAEEMIQKWRQGERPLPEDFLARHPELWQHPEAAAELIYEELCLRQEYNLEVPAEQVLGRFPQWRLQLEVLVDCQRLLGSPPATLPFPGVGEFLGDFLLLTELGRGGLGRVFLAGQLSLGDRPVVLKLTPAEACEHLSLARLQHTHIVPLYSVHDHPDLGIRAQCMPYFGGTTLARLLEELRPSPPAQRTGEDLLEALDRDTSRLPIPDGPSPSPARRFLAQASYIDAICWVGACLADALQYAHERGLVHLDLKPSNVLLTAHGEPMLLDFHLARAPIHADGSVPAWLGGTAGYMSPEQHSALLAAQRGRPVPEEVDGRSDIYSLGVVLYESLCGSLPGLAGGKLLSLCRCNPPVSAGLADVVGKCLAVDPGERYPDMAVLAGDLRRHLAHRPLAGVRNRSLRERWRKWRRRRPHGAALAGMMLTVLAATAAVAFVFVQHFNHQLAEARAALNDGEAQMANGECQGAIATLERGRSLARALPYQRDLADTLDHELERAEQAQAAAERVALVHDLHQLAERIRYFYNADAYPVASLRRLETSCGELWEKRGRIVDCLDRDRGELQKAGVREDLFDLAIFLADLEVRLAPPSAKERACRQARTVLDQAEASLGPNPVLDAERRRYGSSPGSAVTRRAETAWEHCALGRFLLRTGKLERAAQELEQAVRLQPQGLWPNFYRGQCDYRRGRYAAAVAAYSVCIGAAPQPAACFYNRALAFAALGQTEQAQLDYQQAVRLDPTLAAVTGNLTP